LSHFYLVPGFSLEFCSLRVMFPQQQRDWKCLL
jgi:hypothetical protein